MDKNVHYLRVAKDFRSLVQPLNPTEFQKLRQFISKRKTLVTITGWNSYILDGFDEYTICLESALPFRYHELPLYSREEAISWICAKQLERNDLTNERKRYLIGIQFESERALFAQKHMPDSFHLNTSELENMDFLDFNFPQKTLPSRRSLGIRIGKRYHLVWNTVLNYAVYARRIEKLRKVSPEIAEKIIAGQYRVSQNSLAALTEMSTDAIKAFFAHPETESPAQRCRFVFKHTPTILPDPKGAPLSVKDMPSYDPDADLTALTYTIPTWCETIKRVRLKPDIEAGTAEAKSRLADVLILLAQETGMLFDVVMEEK